MGWLKKYQQGGKKDKGFSIEGRVNKWLNDPQGKARKDAENKSGDGDEEIDNIRHASAGRYAAEAIANKTGNIPYVSKPLGVIGANIMGLGHEIGTYVTDPRWTDKNWKVSNFDKAKVISRELLEDAYNNFAGSVIGATDMTPEQKTARIKYLSQNYMIPDGYGLLHPYGDNPTFVDPYSKKKYGGYSTTGYKSNSPDKDNPYNIIPSGRITMQNVPHPVLDIDNLGNRQMMRPGGEYQFQGDQVFEMPVMKEGGIPERYKNMGFTHVGQKKAGDGQHKWKVLAKKGDSYKVVQGGYRGMQDFKQHHSEERKDRFWDRMGGRNSSKAKDPFSPLYWHKRFGTWEYGGPVPSSEMYKDGGMIKRADGSYSQRGLWDNIRANAGSGKKPTKEMLQQEKKIRAAEKKEYGGWLSKYK
jgi:hypothetical protein